MNSQIKNRLFCAALLLSSLQFGLCSNDRPHLLLWPAGWPSVWDISGTYHDHQPVQTSTIQPMDIVYRASTSA